MIADTKKAKVVQQKLCFTVNCYQYNTSKLGALGATVVQELYDFSRNKLQQKVSQRCLVNRGVLYDILKV